MVLADLEMIDPDPAAAPATFSARPRGDREGARPGASNSRLFAEFRPPPRNVRGMDTEREIELTDEQWRQRLTPGAVRGAAPPRDRAAVHRRVRRRQGRRHLSLRRLRRRAVQLRHQVRVGDRLAELLRAGRRRERRDCARTAASVMRAPRCCASAAAATSATCSTTARARPGSATASTPARWTSRPDQAEDRAE